MKHHCPSPFNQQADYNRIRTIDKIRFSVEIIIDNIASGSKTDSGKYKQEKIKIARLQIKTVVIKHRGYDTVPHQTLGGNDYQDVWYSDKPEKCPYMSGFDYHK
jgi:hypothetical protein